MKIAVENIQENGENAGNQHFLLFPRMFSTIITDRNHYLNYINLSFANALDLVMSNILSFGIESKDLLQEFLVYFENLP